MTASSECETEHEWVCGMRQTKMLKSMTMMRMVMTKNGIDAWYCDLKQHKTLTTHRRLLLPTKGFHINHRGRAMCQICLCIYEKVSKIGSGTHNLCVVEAINSKAFEFFQTEIFRHDVVQRKIRLNCMLLRLKWYRHKNREEKNTLKIH